MKNITEEDRRLCSAQANIFESSCNASPSGSAVFIRRFMLSDIAKRMDAGAYAVETKDVNQLVREVDVEYGGRTYGSTKYSPNELHWMGYLYRYWCCAFDISSKRVYGCIGARELRSLYEPYHSLDVAQAVERIMEAKGMASQESDMQRHVRIMREVRARRARKR